MGTASIVYCIIQNECVRGVKKACIIRSDIVQNEKIAPVADCTDAFMHVVLSLQPRSRAVA